jgi:hypothetical protein
MSLYKSFSSPSVIYDNPAFFNLICESPVHKSMAVTSTLAAAKACKRPNLYDGEHHEVYQYLLGPSIHAQLPSGAILDVASLFAISSKTVSRICKQGCLSLANGLDVANVSSRKTGNVGKKKKVITPYAITDIPLMAHSNIRSLANALHIGVATVHNRIKACEIRPHSSTIKPFLIPTNKLESILFCLAQLNPCQLDNHDPTFLDMFDRIHVHEKWFYVTKMASKFYLAASKEEPHRTYKSKNFITKVMFLAAVSRPRWNTSHNQHFNGKLGIWPLVEYVAAKRGSRNRPKGTIETKAMTSVTNVEYAQFITDKLLPAIRGKWPRSRPYHPPKIQQDNARPHIQPTDQRFLDAVASIGMNVQLACQPSNSLDMNVLDLGFFNAIQSLQHQQRCKNIDELIAATKKA